MKLYAVIALALGLVGSNARAWHGAGHVLAVRAAMAALPKDQMPAFFLAGAGLIAHCSIDPDDFMRPIAPAELHDAESPEHHINLESLDANALPPTRYAFLQLCADRHLNPRRVGTLPYAVTEWTQRLAVGLAEHRRWPDNPYIQQKCLIYAGILAHYAADLEQPLHTTIHYDGRAGSDGNSPRSGIHLKLDALLGKLPFPADLSSLPPEVKAFEDILPAVLAEARASHALVPTLYELENQFPAYEQPLEANSPAGRFAQERLRACARFTAGLYLTAWTKSRQITLPQWHQREPGFQEGTPSAESRLGGPRPQPASSPAGPARLPAAGLRERPVRVSGQVGAGGIAPR